MTANQVTALRLLSMPFFAWLFYLGDSGWWAGLAVGTVIGSTDYLDGYLARKQGPTVLGSLLDPIADKLFIALTYLPLVHLGVVPVWPVALLFVRELVVTELRSAYLLRGLQMKTSYLAKVKTWVQMQAVAFIVLATLLASRHEVLLWVVGAAALIPALLGLVLLAVQRRVRQGPFVMAGLVAAVFAICLPEDPHLTNAILMWTVAAMTWLSGLDYLVVGLPRLKAAGGFGRADAVRLVGAIAIPVLAVMVLTQTSIPPAPLFALVGLELAAGGTDNLLSVHKEAAEAAVWGVRVLGVSLLLAVALAVPERALLLSSLAAAVSLAGATVELRRAARHF